MPKTKEQEKIGKFITILRKQANVTQKDLAKELGTSQSAVARMERGEQNFSTKMLFKISKVLNKEVITLPDETMNFKIEGGKKLSGSVDTKVSKNASVALLCATFLNKAKTTLKDIPQIEEVKRIIEVLESLGATVKKKGTNIEIIPPSKIDMSKVDREAFMKTRSAFMLIGPMIHILKNFKVPQTGGCKLGVRTIRPHLFAMEKMGVNIKTTDCDYEVSVKKLKPADVVMYEAGDTATENAIMAAARIPGKTVIKFASANYMVQDLCFFLQKLGVKIDGIGTTTLTIHGKKEINQPVTYSPAEDPIESMLFLAAAIVTNSSIAIKRCPIDFLELELLRLEKMGFKYETLKRYKAKNGATNLVDIKTLPSKLTAPEDKIEPRPYPGINMDNLPFFALIATQAKGTTLIHDWVYENRAIYYTELTKIGADVTLADPHRAFIKGPTKFEATEVVCPPALRPAALILIGMLAAPGTSILRNVYSIRRGYEDISERLNKLGAKVEILKGL